MHLYSAIFLVQKVSPNIRFFVIFSCAVLGVSSSFLYAQTSSPSDDIKPVQASNELNSALENAQASARLSAEKSRSNNNSQLPILRLEETIRGNKEQPQVLTIVPWQLPVQQRINENKDWQLQMTELSSIERNAFLRNLAVVKEIKAAQGLTKPIVPIDKDE